MTGWLFHELYLWHDTLGWNQLFRPGITVQPGVYAENPETKRRFKNLLDACGVSEKLQQIAPRPATVQELLRFHTPDYLERFKALSDAGGGELADATPIGQGSYEIAQLAVGGALAACDAVIDRQVSNAYALLRPPGHHAVADSAMGFCLFANAVLAAEHARAVHGLERVMIVDWDVHHGNGAQSAFAQDAGVLSLSIHQDSLYPIASGGVHETGEGAGEGFNINIPLPAGCGTGAYLHAFERVIAPALRRFEPQLVIVSCGFDAAAMDPLGHMMLPAHAFGEMTRRLMALCDACCDGRLLMLHEGGYSSAYVPYCGLAVIEALSGVVSGVEDPWSEEIDLYGGQSLQPHQQELIQKVSRLHGFEQ